MRENVLDYDLYLAYGYYQMTTNRQGSLIVPGRYDGLNTLLDLDGYTYRLDKGYWVKLEARVVSVTDQIPHGISYCLTLHDHHNRRIIGFDNAHGYSSRSRRKKFGGRKVTWDHKHNREEVTLYDFESAAQLIEDFWEEVGKVV